MRWWGFVSKMMVQIGGTGGEEGGKRGERVGGKMRGARDVREDIHAVELRVRA